MRSSHRSSRANSAAPPASHPLRRSLEWLVRACRRALDLHGAGLRRFYRVSAEAPNQPLHVFAVAVVLDLEAVPGRVFPLDAVTDIGIGPRFHRAEPAGALRVLGLSGDESGNEQGLIVGDLPIGFFSRLESACCVAIIGL